MSKWPFIALGVYLFIISILKLIIDGKTNDAVTVGYLFCAAIAFAIYWKEKK